jgi:hypothetical protein
LESGIHTIPVSLLVPFFITDFEGITPNRLGKLLLQSGATIAFFETPSLLPPDLHP